MKYICTPIQFKKDESSVKITRNIEDKIQMLDNLLELIVFTPKGSFSADPDFGFEYWNHEYSNVHNRDFNNGHIRMPLGGLSNDITKKECQESIRKSIETYEPRLKNIDVSIDLNFLDNNDIHRKTFSKYEVRVKVTGFLSDDLGVKCTYEKEIRFFMEPTVKTK